MFDLSTKNHILFWFWYLILLKQRFFELFLFIDIDELIDKIGIGIMVVVPFGSRKEIGYVSRLKEKSKLNDKNLKKIS